MMCTLGVAENAGPLSWCGPASMFITALLLTRRNAVKSRQRLHQASFTSSAVLFLLFPVRTYSARPARARRWGSARADPDALDERHAREHEQGTPDLNGRDALAQQHHGEHCAEHRHQVYELARTLGAEVRNTVGPEQEAEQRREHGDVRQHREHSWR